MIPPAEASLTHTTKPEIIKDKDVEIETQDEETLFEVFKGGKITHTRPTKKLKYKIKLISIQDSAKEVIDVDNVPLKDLIINKKKVALSKKIEDKETMKKGPMETRQSKKQRLEKVDVLLKATITLG